MVMSRKGTSVVVMVVIREPSRGMLISCGRAGLRKRSGNIGPGMQFVLLGYTGGRKFMMRMMRMTPILSFPDRLTCADLGVPVSCSPQYGHRALGRALSNTILSAQKQSSHSQQRHSACLHHSQPIPLPMSPLPRELPITTTSVSTLTLNIALAPASPHSIPLNPT